MTINIIERISRNKKKVYYSFEWGKGAGQRVSSGIFTYVKPKDQIQRNHNKEALAILGTKQSQLILDLQAINSGYIPQHKFKNNFFEYYAEFVKKNKRAGNRHIEGGFTHFKKFINTDYLAPIDITENLSQRFRQYLLDHFNGDTPANYFARYKRVLKSATKDGYFKNSPAEDVAAKSNKNYKRKENLEINEYILLLKTPCAMERYQTAQ